MAGGLRENSDPRVMVLGAGPAGLTAAYEMSRVGWTSTIVEADSQVGGISKTVERDGWRFDLGGHRFFTKVARVRHFWHEVLSPDEFLLRPRMSRIYYDGDFYDYPLKATNALRNLGFLEAARCVLSYLLVRIKRPRSQDNFEGWVAARFGWRLYGKFFKTYTEKVWGIPATSIRADWAAQRIKNLSLGRAIWNAISPVRKQAPVITSLIEQFEYPRLGPGMMWERVAERVTSMGHELVLNCRPLGITRATDGTLRVRLSDGTTRTADAVVSTIAINHLVLLLEPPPEEDVIRAAASLKHRDFLTVALVVPEIHAFPDNWIYVHSPEVQVGRIQNFGSWSPYMVKPGFTCLGMEYFVNRGEGMWLLPDDQLVDLARTELLALGLVPEKGIAEGFVVRVPHAYPIYDEEYVASLRSIRSYLDEHWPEIHPVGRNGMHRYNNQDHSMLTAMLTVDRLRGLSTEDPWDVNVEDEYHEETRVREDARNA